MTNQPMVSTNMLEEAVRFHGHLGPFLVLGLRAGIFGVKYLGQSHFTLRAIVGTATRPPRSCFIDGIQFASGCTLGKGNIEVRNTEGVEVTFTTGEREVRLIVKDDILEALDQMSSESQAETCALEILKRSDDELFFFKCPNLKIACERKQ
jgi:formylmethanofuran dehydrogenase subunit E